jgi:ribosome biogenesis GTPase A
VTEAAGTQPIHWFPGHMATSMRKIGEALKLVDVAVEVVDARIPATSTNEDLRTLVRGKPIITVLSREDLADPAATAAWLDWLRAQGRTALAVDAKRHGSVSTILEALRKYEDGRSIRIIVVGIPNAGKSTVINSLLRRTAAKAEDRAGVTRALQWFRVDPRVELMDTPGVLVPKVASAEAQWRLAVTGALPRQRYDPQDVVARFEAWNEHRTGTRRFPALEEFAAKRGFLRKGGEPDAHNAARAYLAELNAGTFGRLTLDVPPA